jgi:hypothetical protein
VLIGINDLDVVSPEEIVIPQLKETSPPTFTAPPNWLEGIGNEILKRMQDEDTEVERVPPLCLSRCSRGGKTRSLYEIAKFLKEQKEKIAVIFVTLNDFSDIKPWEQEDPVRALFQRIAFAALRNRSYEDSVAQYHSLEKKSISKESIEKWLADKPCVLLVDELNLVGNFGLPKSEPLADVLKSMFLKQKGRYFVFTTHVVSIDAKLQDFMESVSSRDVLKRALPLIPSMSSAVKNLSQTLTVQDAYYYGLVPALMYVAKKIGPHTLKVNSVTKNWIQKAKVDEHTVLKLLASLVNGNRDNVPEELMQFMDVTDGGLVRWIPCQMHQIFEKLSRLPQLEKLRMNLCQINSLLSTLKDAKLNSGDAWESLFVLVLFVRALTGQAHTFMGTADIAMGTQVEYNVPHTCLTTKKMQDFLEGITKNLERGPQITLYYPPHASFPHYDCFLVSWDSDGKISRMLGYQLKEGKDLPSSKPSAEVDSSYVIRGAATQKPGNVRGWITPSKEEVNDFFGVSGKQWTPEQWKAITSL